MFFGELKMKKFLRPNLPLFALALFLSTAGAVAQDKTQDGGITVWPKGMPPGGITQKVDFGDHLLEISHREVNGKAELHKTKADVMVIQTGTATLVTGGEVIDPKDTAPNEIQGSGIKGGVTRTVVPGDIINIPAGVPHQFFVTSGTQITYLVVKVTKQ
jgi:mannose-6-phosphate isomerase-like protein (cupin superfamily)